MKLNDSQIQDLYTFTKQHFVEYYDLQTELVDHLANDIEAMWEKQPELSFEDAKLNAFKKFGIFGFMDPIEQKQKAMNKRYRHYLWVELKLWFTIPKIIITITLFSVLYMVFSTTFAKHFAMSFYIIFGLWCGYKGWQLNKVYKSRKEKSNKKWLLEDIVFKQAVVTTLFIISQFYSVFNLSVSFTTNNYKVVAMALLVTFMILLNYISLVLLPNKAENLLKETYPEFSL